MNKFGLIGEHLGHSYSPRIHSMLKDYEYGLYEVRPEELENFLQSTDLGGMNVTIPYKKAVIPLCESLSPSAKAIGSVNTLVRRPDGKWHGDNTDYDGFRYTVECSGVSVAGKKAVIFGNGGVAPTIRAVLEDMGAETVVTVSRKGEDNYDNLSRHSDAAIIVNATPVGMYPKNGEKVADLDGFPQCEAVFDLIYNPARTALLLQAEENGMVAINGLRMLVMQAKRAAELFTGEDIDSENVERINSILSSESENIILVGMPGCGKSTVGECLARITGRELIDVDAEIVKDAGCTIPEIFAQGGEELFRRIETKVLDLVCRASGKIIATGGGCVTQERNYNLLHQNGRIFWISRDLDCLATEGRPLSQLTSMQEMFKVRKPMYERFSDVAVVNDGTPDQTAQKILEAMK